MKCNNCGEEKDSSEFHKEKNKKGSLVYRKECKDCRHAKNSQWHKRNADKHAKRMSVYYNLHKERVSELRKQRYAEADKEERKRKAHERYRSSKEKIAEYAKKNRTRINKWFRDKEKIDPLFRIARRIRGRLRSAIRAGGFAKRSRTAALLGCTYAELLAHLGPAPESAHLDHICPCAQARSVEELEKLQHFSNLRWLPATENLSKSDARTSEGEYLCLLLLGREWIDA